MSQLIQITDNQGRQLEPASDVKPLDLEEVRARLAASQGQAYWRSLEEVAAEPGFGAMLQREFPGQAPKDWAPLPRRDFVRLMGASLALAGLSGCAFQPQEKIVPYVKQPEEIVPGVPLYYASAMTFGGYAQGVLAESHMGRPTKVEGNPDCTTSRGATDQWVQASVLDLYDPDRSQFVRNNSASSSWDALAGAVTAAMNASSNGATVALLTETITSPTLLGQIADLKRRRPGLKWYTHEPAGRSNVLAGAALAFNKPVQPVYHFDRADIIVSLDCDFLLEEPGRVAHSREFIAGRRLSDKLGINAKDGTPVMDPNVGMNRLYAIESTPTITGSSADHRLPMKAAEVELFARSLAAALKLPGATAVTTAHDKFISILAEDLVAHRGRVLLCAGAHQPASVHALAFALTAFLGSVGPTSAISFVAPIEGRADGDLEDLYNRLTRGQGGQVDALIMLGTNPAYSAPGNIPFGDAIYNLVKRGGLAVHHGSHEDETSLKANWHVPAAHYLEYWGDARNHNGQVVLIQPTIKPLYDAAKSVGQMLALLAGAPHSSDYEVVRANWAARSGQSGVAFDKYWQRAVHDGVIGEPAPSVGVAVASGLFGRLPAAPAVSGGLEVNFRPDPTIWDGRFANNGWLQEVPKPVSRTTWDNAIFVAPKLAAEMGLRTNDRVRLTVGDKFVEGAAFLQPGQPESAVTVHLGYGRTNVGKIGKGAGFDANAIRSTRNPWFAAGATLEKLGGVYKIASTSQHNLIAPHGKDTTWGDALKGNDDAKTKIINNILVPESRDMDIDGTHGRDLVRVGTLQELKAKHAPVNPQKDWRGLPFAYPNNPDAVREIVALGNKENKFPTVKNRDAEGFPQFYPRDADYLATKQYVDEKHNAALNAKDGEGIYAWGMSVDLQSCIGCNACVVGCQSENNSAIVGKDQVLMGREMHWIRIDTYYRGTYENPEVYFEPMMCQHCEKAPCAPVCPFNATMNSPEGVNEQVYNRCVGTKYCENNCPYKVRRFNFLQYADQQTPVIQLMANPDVTVRSRGVMEKCTYCVQRVNAAKWQADKENRRVRDGEVKTACQQACPTQAIVFGNINDKNSRVTRLKFNPLNFGLLTDHNTLPRTTYLARIKNPNPKIESLGAMHDVKSMVGGFPAGEGGHGAGHGEGHGAGHGDGHAAPSGEAHGSSHAAPAADPHAGHNHAPGEGH